jgi:uncharacterized RDD family membrane protein YckC
VFCSKCGNAVAPDSTFCTACGTPQVHPALANPAAVTVPPNVGVAGYTITRGSLAYGGFWLRFVAYLLDNLITSLAIVPLFVLFVVFTGAAAHLHISSDDLQRGQMDPAMIAAIISAALTFVILSLVITWLYHAYFDSSSWQATPGKRVMNLYVTNVSGQPITFLHATGRHFAKIISGFIPLGIGYIMAGFTERKQALHDMIASTLVLRR